MRMRQLWNRLPSRVAALSRVACLGACVACASTGGDPGAAGTASVGELVAAAERASAAGDTEGAVASYRAANERTPWNPRLRSALAVSLSARAATAREQGDASSLERAEADLREACALAPDDAILRRNLALVLTERAAATDDPAAAEALAREARGLDPAVPASVPAATARLHERLARIQEQVDGGELDAAIAGLEGLLREHPGEVNTTRLLGQALVRRGGAAAARGEARAAAQDYDRAVELFSTPGLCRPGPCQDNDARQAHRGRIEAWLRVPGPAEAKRALAEAEAQGIRFPELAREVAGQR
jgi:tetratricopeptide (TPR) repeat protein